MAKPLPICLGCWLAAVNILCGGEPKMPPSAHGRPPVAEWHDQHDLPWEVEPSSIKFHDKNIGRMFIRADEATRQVAKSNWNVKAGNTYPYVSWNSVSRSKAVPLDYTRTYQAEWSSDGSPKQEIALSTTLYESSQLSHGFEIDATCDNIDGWSSSIRYGRSTGINGSIRVFHLGFSHPVHWPNPKSGRKSMGLRLSPGDMNFAASRRDDLFEYEFFVPSRLRGKGGSIYHSDAADIVRYWKSPESFREAAVDELDRLESLAREWIGSGRAGEIKAYIGPRIYALDEDPPHSVGDRGDAIPVAMREEVLAEALKGIAAKKRLVEEHFESMYQAATSAFPPLPDVIDFDQDQ